MFNHPLQLDHDICLPDWEKKVDRCFDKAFENMSLDLFWKMLKEMKEMYPYMKEVMLSVLSSTICVWFKRYGNSPFIFV